MLKLGDGRAITNSKASWLKSNWKFDEVKEKEQKRKRLKSEKQEEGEKKSDEEQEKKKEIKQTIE